MNTELEIIATLGPGVADRISELIQAGTTAFRLNCSHISLESVSQWLVKIDRAFRNVNKSIPLWLDLQGAKLRIGKLVKPVKLTKGSVVTFVPNYSQLGDEIPLPHKNVFDRIQPHDKISLNDGRIILDVQRSDEAVIKATVLNDGEISSFKGFNIDGYEDYLEEIFSRDLAFIEQTMNYDNVGYAVSYIQTADEINLVREYTGDRPITAKIERLKTFDSLREIANCSDALWLCRGDLGVEANIYNLFHFEKVFLQRLLLIEKPYLIAGQVLENMVKNPNPSRSEIAHLGYLIENGFKGVVLSDETAIGRYPIKAVEFCRDYFKFLLNL